VTAGRQEIARSRLLSALALALAVAAALGCKSDDKKKPATEPALPEHPALRGLDAIPAGMRVAVGVDVPKLSRSPLVQRAVSQMFARDPELKKRFDALSSACKFDPVEQLSSFVIGMGQGDEVVLAATGEFREPDIAVCVDKTLAADGGHLTTQTVAGRSAYRADSGQARPAVWFAFGGPDTLVVSSLERLLADALGNGTKASADDRLAPLIARARPQDAAIWGAGAVPPAVGEGLVKATTGKVGAPQAMFGRVRFDAGLHVELGAVMASPEDAKTLESEAKPQLELVSLAAQKYGLGRLVAQIGVRTDASTVVIELVLSEDQLREVLSRIDTEDPSLQNPSLDAGPGPEGAGSDGKRDAAPGSQTPLREQGKAD
jgi:hypothetical protein